MPEPAPLALELAGDEGSIRLRWDPALSPAAEGGDRGASSPWELESELDWKHTDSLRLISARFQDGRALALAAMRPRGAEGHDEDLVVASLVGGEGEQAATSEALVSAEYGSAEMPRRLGIELWLDPESAPLRIAADAEGEVERSEDRVARRASRMRFRLDGIEGNGLYEVLEPA